MYVTSVREEGKTVHMQPMAIVAQQTTSYG